MGRGGEGREINCPAKATGTEMTKKEGEWGKKDRVVIYLHVRARKKGGGTVKRRRR